MEHALRARVVRVPPRWGGRQRCWLAAPLFPRPPCRQRLWSLHARGLSIGLATCCGWGSPAYLAFYLISHISPYIPGPALPSFAFLRGGARGARCQYQVPGAARLRKSDSRLAPPPASHTHHVPHHARAHTFIWHINKHIKPPQGVIEGCSPTTHDPRPRPTARTPHSNTPYCRPQTPAVRHQGQGEARPPPPAPTLAPLAGSGSGARLQCWGLCWWCRGWSWSWCMAGWLDPRRGRCALRVGVCVCGCGLLVLMALKKWLMAYGLCLCLCLCLCHLCCGPAVRPPPSQRLC
jgi:hypothetical protein